MHDGKSCDVGQISSYSPQIKGMYAAISVTEDTGQNSQLYNSAISRAVITTSVTKKEEEITSTRRFKNTSGEKQ